MMKKMFALMVFTMVINCFWVETAETMAYDSMVSDSIKLVRDSVNGSVKDSMPVEVNARLYHSKAQQEWVENIFGQMTTDEKIGQLFMGIAYSNLGASHVKSIEKLIADNHIGGLIFMQGGPVRQAKLTNHYQSLSKIPLMISMDAENGLSMRLDSTMSFPKAMTLGAIDNDEYIYEMGKEIARQCRRIGTHVNFGPVVDINVDPNNPVIGVRSFGENKVTVAKKGVAYMKGMQHNGVIANAKHFPGHGDTNKDSHYSLPVINHSADRLGEVELFPFRKLIEDSLQSVMVAHLYIPAYEKTANMATSLSKHVVTELLQNELGFEGLIFTDGLNMQGVTKYHTPGEICLKAIQAGNDILLGPTDIPAGHKAIKDALYAGVLSQEEIDRKVKKILSKKYWLGLHKYAPVKIEGLHTDINPNRATALKALLYEQAVTIVSNKERMLPIMQVDSLKFASVSIGESQGNSFQAMLDKYASFDNYALPSKNVPQNQLDAVLAKVKDKDIVVVGIHQMNNSRSQQYGVNANTVNFVKKLQQHTKVVVVAFGNPYSMYLFDEADYAICAYEDDPLAQLAVPQVIFGAVNSYAKLPVTASEKYTEGTGFRMISLGRLGYALPEAVGMNSRYLHKIDSVVYRAMGQEAIPGGQVLVVKDGRIVFEKAYGHHTYSRKEKVTDTTVYDIASLTKVLATLQAVMLLEGQGKLDINKTLVEYLPELKGTNKADIVIRDILVHQAGLKAFYPFWANIMKKDEHDPKYLSATYSKEYPVQITPYLYAIEGIQDSVWRWTVETGMTTKRSRFGGYGYLYSDLGFIIMQKLIETISGESLDKFVSKNFYSPMGLKYMTYKPLERFNKSQIPPTEMDIYRRKTLVHGHVHDPGAALLDGVAGHAGVFSNARDIATLLQMNLQEGYYGGKFFLQPETIAKFNHRISKENRRGLGWDKPSIKKESTSSSALSSESTFGHTGFTGTCAWVDPTHQMVYVFLSNRIHPFIGNQKLIRENVRTVIQDIIYESMDQYKEPEAIGRNGGTGTLVDHSNNELRGMIH